MARRPRGSHDHQGANCLKFSPWPSAETQCTQAASFITSTGCRADGSRRWTLSPGRRLRGTRMLKVLPGMPWATAAAAWRWVAASALWADANAPIGHNTTTRLGNQGHGTWLLADVM